MTCSLVRHAKLTALSLATICLLAVGQADATLIGQYHFDDGTADDSSGSGPNLTVNGAPVFQDGAVTFDGNVANYLAAVTSNPSSVPQFTVSTWVRADTTNQGTFKGIFSNNVNTAAFTWQLDNHNGAYRMVSGSGVSFTGPTSGAGSPNAGQWDNVVVRKVSGGSSAELYLNGQLVGTDNANLGNLVRYRLGINRSTDNSYAMDLDGVQVWDSLEDVSRIFAAGRFTPTNSWVAGEGTDVSGDGDWTAAAGTQDITFSSGTPNTVPVTSPTIYGFDNAYKDVTGRIVTSTNGLFDVASDATWELWFKPDNLSGDHVLYELGGNGSGTVLALLDDELRLVSQTSGAVQMTTNTTLLGYRADTWIHAVGVITDPGDGSGILQLYLDGKLVSTNSLTAGSGFSTWAGGNASGLGHIEVNAAGGITSVTDFDGEFAILNYYDRALSADIVQELFLASAIVPEPSTWLLGAIGMVALLGLGWRKSRRG